MAEQKTTQTLPPIDATIGAGIGNYEALIKKLLTDSVERKTDQWINEYNGVHEIRNRPDKIIGEGDESKSVKVNKIPLRYQKKIVNSSTSFLLGKPVDLILNNKEERYTEPFNTVTEIYKNNKLKYFDKKLFRSFLIETKVAELWYAYIAPGDSPEIKRYRVKLLCKKNGDEINAHFDKFGDMDAFMRKYKTVNDNGDEIDHADIYTATTEYSGIKTGGSWIVKKSPNIIGKIPVIYYEREEPDWMDVQEVIDRIEMLVSRHADTNDYFGDPILKTWGQLLNPPKKGEVGKILQFPANIGGEKSGDASYLEWNSSPESIKLEYNNLKDIIYSITDTPDLSFSNVNSLPNLSGIAIRLMFFAALLKADSNQEVMGECFQRRLNLIKTILSATNVKAGEIFNELSIAIKFNNPLPESVEEIMNALATARGGAPTMSAKTAVQHNPFVDDPEAELKELDKEQAAKSQFTGEAFNI